MRELNPLPQFNLTNFRFALAWVALVIFALMFWHFALRTTARAL